MPITDPKLPMTMNYQNKGTKWQSSRKLLLFILTSELQNPHECSPLVQSL